jgi:hypothetical protein
MAALDFVAAGIIVLSLALLPISLNSYRRTGNTKILFTFVAFLLFFFVGVALFFYQFTPDSDPETYLTAIGMMNLLVLLLMYFATLKR